MALPQIGVQSWVTVSLDGFVSHLQIQCFTTAVVLTENPSPSKKRAWQWIHISFQPGCV